MDESSDWGASIKQTKFEEVKREGRTIRVSGEEHPAHGTNQEVKDLQLLLSQGKRPGVEKKFGEKRKNRFFCS